MNKIERVAKILELAEIPYSWLKRDADGRGISLMLDDNSSTISVTNAGGLRIFVSSDVSFATYEYDDIGDALRIIMEVRYMLRVDGAVKKTKADEWIE